MSFRNIKKILIAFVVMLTTVALLAPPASAEETIKIHDVHGEVEVPVNPERVVALDNRTFETLADWNVKVLAVPKDVMDANSPYAKDEKVKNIGNHREPDLELIAALDPDLVIIGQRFASHYDEIKALVPEACVIDLTWDVSEEAETPGENLINGLKEGSEILGQIFLKEAEAQELVADFDEALETVKANYNKDQSVMGVVVSGGEIGFSAPKSGRVWGPLFEVFDWKPALEIDNNSSDHKGDEISVEAIAESNPQWLLVLDRDAAVAGSDSQPAKDVVENAPALKETDAIKNNHVVYAPNNTYVNESIQTYIDLFTDLTEAFK